MSLTSKMRADLFRNAGFQQASTTYATLGALSSQGRHHAEEHPLTAAPPSDYLELPLLIRQPRVADAAGQALLSLGPSLDRRLL
jgi:hypothetical protein